MCVCTYSYFWVKWECSIQIMVPNSPCKNIFPRYLSIALYCTEFLASSQSISIIWPSSLRRCPDVGGRISGVILLYSSLLIGASDDWDLKAKHCVGYSQLEKKLGLILFEKDRIEMQTLVLQRSVSDGGWSRALVVKSCWVPFDTTPNALYPKANLSTCQHSLPCCPTCSAFWQFVENKPSESAA